ncbi:MAG: NAD-dependent protein deacylase, partial [Lachnospiraceae bacterium]|nr:NAD-dependent protein deacylase [Lachnospiraceae bacterium]
YEPKVYYEFHRQKMDTRNIEANNAHKYLAKLEEKGKLIGIVTQNIDGLHQKAGSRKVYEIHGSALRNYCMKCGKTYPSDYIFESEEAIPHCECGGTIRPDITLYEEGLPEDQVQGAISALSKADMLIIGGTSLTVYPAASFINYFNGNTVVVINESEISVKPAKNTLVIRRRIGELFTELASLEDIEL